MSTRDDGLDGAVAAITGGASGIGRALAVAYARAGARSVIGYLDADPHDAQATVRAVREVGGECLAVAADVRDGVAVDAMMDAALGTFGRLDAVVANAGILRADPLATMTDAAWEAMLDVDLTGVMRTFRAGAARMADGGAMVAVSSISGGVYGWEEHAHYAAAKAGVVGLCRAAAMELAPRGIRVNAVIPGLIETPQSLDAENSLGPDGLRAAAASIPAGRVGAPDEVARVIRMLTGADGTYVTGQALIVDGGLTARWPA